MDEQSPPHTGTVPRRGTARRRIRASVAAWVAVSLALVGVAATSGSGGAVPDLGFRQVGHWVYSGTLGRVFHVNGASKAVDASGKVEGGRLAGGPAVQSPGSVFVPGEGGSTIEFGKSKLKVKSVRPSGVNELPVGLEVPGGPYYVYRQSGVVQRLSPLATIPLGGSLGDPVATTDGTVWLLRLTDGAVCSLARTATEVSCADRAPAGHRGALTVIGDRPAFVDTTSSEVRRIGADGFGPAMPVGTRLGDDAKVAPADASGTLPIVRSSDRALLLVDTSRLAPGRQPAAPRRVELPSGDMSTPATAGRAVAVVDQRNDKLVTYDAGGAKVESADLPAGSTVRLSRAQDGRVYADVDGPSDRAVVIDGTGRIDEVPLTDPVPGGTPDPGPGQPAPPSTTAPPTTPPASPTATPAPTTSTAPTEPPEESEAPEPPEPSDSPSGSPLPDREPTTPPAATAPPQPTRPTQPTQPTLPGAPRAVQATVSGPGATLTWQPGPSNGAPITAYLVSWRPAAGGTVVDSRTLPGDARRATVTGLSAGLSYVATVAAQNRAGRGTAAESNPVTFQPAGPGAPTGVRAAAGTDGSVTVTFRPATGTGITGYVVTASDGATQRATGRRAVFRTLRVGVRYTFTVAAVASQGGSGPPSAASNAATPYRPAGAPGTVRATRGDRAATLTWAAPALNGGELVNYRITATGVSRTVTGPRATVDGLVPGRAYSFTVRTTTRGQGGSGPAVAGAPSAPVAVTAVGVPKVDVVSAERSGGGVTVVAQVDDGAAAMTGCRVLIGTQSFPGLSCQAGRATFQLGTAPAGTPMVTATGTNAVGTGQPGAGRQLAAAPACQSPSDVLSLGGWSLGLPTGEVVSSLAGYSADPWFVTTPDCTGVRFRAAVDGETTSNSLYPRSALRNTTEWSSTSGTHTMSVRVAVTRLPNGTPTVVVAQVHDASDDLATFRLEGSTLYLADGDDSHYRTIATGVGVGSTFEARFVVSGGEIQAFYNGAPAGTISGSFSGGYFQAGAFTQANCDNSSPCSSANYGEVVIRGLTVTHS